MWTNVASETACVVLVNPFVITLRWVWSPFVLERLNFDFNSSSLSFRWRRRIRYESKISHSVVFDYGTSRHGSSSVLLRVYCWMGGTASWIYNVLLFQTVTDMSYSLTFLVHSWASQQVYRMDLQDLYNDLQILLAYALRTVIVILAPYWYEWGCACWQLSRRGCLFCTSFRYLKLCYSVTDFESWTCNMTSWVHSLRSLHSQHWGKGLNHDHKYTVVHQYWLTGHIEDLWIVHWKELNSVYPVSSLYPHFSTRGARSSKCAKNFVWLNELSHLRLQLMTILKWFQKWLMFLQFLGVDTRMFLSVFILTYLIFTFCFSLKCVSWLYYPFLRWARDTTTKGVVDGGYFIFLLNFIDILRRAYTSGGQGLWDYR